MLPRKLRILLKINKMDKEIKIFVIVVLLLFIPYYIWYSINAGSGPIVIILTTVIVAFGLLTYTIKKMWPKSRLAKIVNKIFVFFREVFPPIFPWG